MSMFSSRPSFNDDPHPWVWSSHSPRNKARADTDMYRAGANGRLANYEHAPRPEYDRPRNNPMNPILARFREGNGCGGFPVAYWAHRLGKGDAPDGVDATPEQIEHARLVLSRLARFQEVD